MSDQLVKELNVTVVPLTIRFGSEELVDRVQLDAAEFWERCKGKGALPETAAPAPGSFLTAYERAAAEGADGVLCLTLSSKLSATYASALAAAESFSTIPVQVVDTCSVTMGEGLLVVAAAEEAAAGSSLDALVAATHDRISPLAPLQRHRWPGAPPAWRAYRWGTRPPGLPAQHQAGDPGQRR